MKQKLNLLYINLTEKKINFSSENYDWKKFEKNNVAIALNA